MSDRFDDDLMDDLAEPEGPAYTRQSFDDLGDLGDDLADFGDEFDDSFDDAADEIDDAVAEVLQADDADEFLGGLRNVLKKVAPIISKVAPMLPIPGAAIIGKAADIVSKVAADEADEMDAIDDLADLSDEADSMDPVAPVVAGLAIKKAIPTVSRLPHGTRKQLVKATTAATKQIARQHGSVAAKAMPAIVRHARRTAAKQGAPASALPGIVRKTAAKVARSPNLVHKMAQTSQHMRATPGIGMMGPGRHRRRRRRYHGYGGFGGYGGHGGYGGYGGYDRYGTWGGGYGSRSLSFRGPVRVTIESM